MEQLVMNEIKRYKQWMMGATKPKALVLPKAALDEYPERSYNLKNNTIRKYLQHEEQTFGINLGWTDDGSNETGDRVSRWFFANNDNANMPIRFGETIALGNGKSPTFLSIRSAHSVSI